MGAVYLARQTALGDRPVALKILPPPLSLTDSAVARFQREAQALAKLRHPAIVPVYTNGCAGGLHYIAMEYVEGVSLDHLVAFLRSEESADVTSMADAMVLARRFALLSHSDEGAPFRRLAGEAHPCRAHWYFDALYGIGAVLAEALHWAHEAGVLHRDVKPSNVLLLHEARPVLIDFGLARDTGCSRITRTGELLGTPTYSAPEQLLGDPEAVDRRADVYALGATLFELATLRPPYNMEELRRRIRDGFRAEPPRLRASNARAPADLEAIVAKALEPRAAMRYATAKEMAGDLRSASTGGPIRVRRLGRAVLWARRIRRRPGRAALTLAGIVFLSLAASLLARSYWAGRRIRDLEFDRLLTRGIEGISSIGRYTWFGRGKLEELIEPLRQAALLHEKRADPWLYMALIYREFGRDEEQYEALERAHSIDPDHGPTLLLRIRCAESLAKGATRRSLLAEARADRERLRSLSGMQGMREWLDGQDHARRGAWESASAAFDRAVAFLATEAEPFPGFGFEVHLARAQALIGEARFGEAREACAAAKALRPSSAAPDIVRACASYLQGEPEQAERILLQTLESHPDNWREVMEVLHRIGDWARVCVFAKRANEIDLWERSPSLPRGLMDWGFPVIQELYLAVRLSEGARGMAELAAHINDSWSPDEALRILEEAMRRDPHDPWPHGVLGRMYQGAGRLDEAVHLYRHAMEFEEIDEGFVRLGDSLMNLCRHDEALSAYRKANALTGPVGQFCERECRALQALGREEEAGDIILHFTRRFTTRANPEFISRQIVEGLEDPVGTIDEHVRRYPNPLSYAVRTLVYGRKNRGGDLRQRLDAEIEAGVNLPLVYFERSRLRAKEGDLEGAVVEIRKALELRPDRSAFWATLADWLIQLGRSEEGRKARWQYFRLTAPAPPHSLWTLGFDEDDAMEWLERWAREVWPWGPTWLAVDRWLAEQGVAPGARIAYWRERE
ncbi:MAG: protein kinase, partial [Planctomycetes bacterium]|nr:protein kinase [Planctomycetota bacterium]